MNLLSIYTLMALRKLYVWLFPVAPLPKPECVKDANIASKLIYDKLILDAPCMIARFGAFELAIMVNYLGVKMGPRPIVKYLKGEEKEWWWIKSLMHHMQSNAGFFPATIEKIEQFCNLMLSDMKELDILGSWLGRETYFDKETRNCQKIDLELLNPYFSKDPWTKALKHKKVLVVHPFARSIESQYRKRELLFADQQILPEFELTTLKAVQSIGGHSTFADWFEALDYMKAKIDQIDYDICLLGCGAYGFPLAAHIKRAGKKAFHLGGSLQLLFGIRGKRWENPEYNEQFNYAALMNEHWIRPHKDERPQNAKKVENGCYW